MLTLYGNWASGHSYKVALFLELADAAYRYEEIDIFVPREPAFVQLSRHNEVPVLVCDGKPIVQSNAILIWLAAQFGRFGGQTDAARTTIHEWLFWEMSRLSLGVANLRFMRRFETDTPEALLAHYAKRCVAALDELDAALLGRAFLLGSDLTIADIACCGYLFWSSEAGIDRKAYSNIDAWLSRIAQQPRWQPPEQLLGESR
jgi:glutathione S-transferase